MAPFLAPFASNFYTARPQPLRPAPSNPDHRSTAAPYDAKLPKRSKMDSFDDETRRFLDRRNELLKKVRQGVESDYRAKVAAPRQRLVVLGDELARLRQQKAAAEDKVKRHGERRAAIREAKNIIQHEEAMIKAECDELHALGPLLQSIDKEIVDIRTKLDQLKKKRAQDELSSRIHQSGVLPTPREETPAIFSNNNPQPEGGAKNPPTPLRTPQPGSEEGSAPGQRRESGKRRRGKCPDSNYSGDDDPQGESHASKRSKVGPAPSSAVLTTAKTFERTIPFDDVFANDRPVLGTAIIEHPPKSNRWFILRCDDHNRYFKTLASATGHLCQGEHQEKNCPHQKTKKILGVRVLDCTDEKAKRNNDALIDPKNQSLQNRPPRARKPAKKLRLPEPQDAEEEGGSGGKRIGNEIPHDNTEDQCIRELQRDDSSDPTHKDNKSRDEDSGWPLIRSNMAGHQGLPKARQEIGEREIDELINEGRQSEVLNYQQMPPKP